MNNKKEVSDNQGFNEDQFVFLLGDLFDKYKKVMAGTNSVFKRAATLSLMNALHRVKEQGAKMIHDSGIDFDEIAPVVENHPSHFSQKMRELKQKIKEINHYIKKETKVAKKKPQTKKGSVRKKRITHQLRSKEGK